LALLDFKCTDFRCLASASLVFTAGNNLIYGANASGKTSLLEAVGYLGRARSFRGAGTREIVRYGCEAFVLFGRADTGGRVVPLGVRNGGAGLEVHIGGEKQASAVGLAEALPLQVIDPDVHELVAGGPEYRRRYIDWVAFHVEPSYLDEWRRFRRVLKQRNAALRDKADRASLSGWDQEFAGLGQAVDEARKRMVAGVGPALEALGAALLGSRVGLEYRQGWPAESSLAEALAGSHERDRELGSSQYGPQRADLRLSYDERQARKLVSRGQQKLLACALILAAVEVVQGALGKPLTLLLDDPAAELDSDSVKRLMAAVERLGSQVIATTLDPSKALFSMPPTLFHVEQGRVQTVP